MVRLGQQKILVYRQTELDAFRAWQTQQAARQQTQREQHHKQLQDSQQQESADFYRQYSIPFGFSIETKEVLSGLSARSNGDGRKKNTVYHLHTRQPVQVGNLRRDAYTFLCGESRSKRRGNWSDTLGSDTHRLADGAHRVPTCQACLRLLERFKLPEG